MITNFLSYVTKRTSYASLSLLATAGLLVSTTSLALAATAAVTTDSGPAAVPDPALSGNGTGGGIFEKFLIPFSNFLAAAVGLIVVISIIYGAIEYSSAGGDPNKAAKARGRISKAVVSLIVFFFLYAILQWIVPGGIGG